jgi:hypothetical protein
MSSANPLDTTGLCPDQILFLKRVERAEKFVRDLLSYMNSYHDHKENLAHASIAVMGGLVGSILITDTWPPKWMTCFSPKIITLIVFILWVLIHVYMRWQLRQRRSAAIMFNAATRKLAEWIERTPTPNDFELRIQQPSRRLNKVWFLLDHFLVFRQGILFEHNARLYPNWIMVLYERERKEMHGILAEWILTVVSIGLGSLVLLRTCFFYGQ